MTGAWQPIDTAPRTGEPVFVFIPFEGSCAVAPPGSSRKGFRDIVVWSESEGRWRGGGVFGKDQPTHWLPTPKDDPI